MLDFSISSATNTSLEPTELENLLSYLHQVHQIDLTGYQRPSLLRRSLKRMRQVGVRNYQEYLDYLQHSDEVTHLLNTIYINYTYFFRDRLVWNYLADSIIPQIIANKAPDQPIRIWSAGCASGEEIYSLAMLFAEALGVEQFRQRVQIYGTDVDADAVTQARQGQYRAYAVAAVPPALQAQYFERKNDFYCWRSDLRDAIRFYRHNLIQDPPLPRIDLLLCRNLLIYLTLETQQRIQMRLHWSLEEDGLLLLGQTESLIAPVQRSLFQPMHLQIKLFTKVPMQLSPSGLSPFTS